MIQSAAIPTEKAERLLKAMCNHFARKTTATYEGNEGHIEFSDAKCDLTATASLLILQVEADNADTLTRVEQRVINHLLRFAPEDNLEVIWKDL